VPELQGFTLFLGYRSGRGSVSRKRPVKLPAVDRAVVAEAKIRDYLLSDSHPVGRFKAAFFAMLGYSAADWESLAADLRCHAEDNEAVVTQANEYGQKYEVRGRIEGSAGKAAVLVAVWIVLHDEDFPRFVTAFPVART
jgi:hypothetical protein